MNNDQYSLHNLRDIIIPDPPSDWPPATGVWILLAMVSLVIMIICWYCYTRRKKNAHRRAGLELLGQARTVYDVSVLLKRVALAVFGREQIASLYGQTWTTFLNSACSRCDFSKMSLTEPNANASQELIDLARVWIKHHRVPFESGSALTDSGNSLYAPEQKEGD